MDSEIESERPETTQTSLDAQDQATSHYTAPTKSRSNSRDVAQTATARTRRGRGRDRTHPMTPAPRHHPDAHSSLQKGAPVANEDTHHDPEPDQPRQAKSADPAGSHRPP